MLWNVIRKAKEIHCNEQLTLSTNKSKTSWNIINNEISTPSNEKYIQTEFKLGNKNINTKQSYKFLIIIL